MRQRQPGSRSTFPQSMAAGWLLAAAALLGAVLLCVGSVRLFTGGMERYVVQPGILSQSDAEAFAAETIAYLNGRADSWEPSVTYGDHLLVIPQTFYAHMASVRRGVAGAKLALLGLLTIGLGLLAQRLRRETRLSFGGYAIGVALVWLLVLAVAVWSLADFNGFWGWLHHTFIPDGIFNASEEVMQMFPETLFAAYLMPLALWFGGLSAAALLLPKAVKRLKRPKKKDQ